MPVRGFFDFELLPSILGSNGDEVVTHSSRHVHLVQTLAKQNGSQPQAVPKGPQIVHIMVLHWLLCFYAKGKGDRERNIRRAPHVLFTRFPELLRIDSIHFSQPEGLLSSHLRIDRSCIQLNTSQRPRHSALKRRRPRGLVSRDATRLQCSPCFTTPSTPSHDRCALTPAPTPTGEWESLMPGWRACTGGSHPALCSP